MDHNRPHCCPSCKKMRPAFMFHIRNKPLGAPSRWANCYECRTIGKIREELEEYDEVTPGTVVGLIERHFKDSKDWVQDLRNLGFDLTDGTVQLLRLSVAQHVFLQVDNEQGTITSVADLLLNRETTPVPNQHGQRTEAIPSTPPQNSNTSTPGFETTTSRLCSSPLPAITTMSALTDGSDDTDTHTSTHQDSREATPVLLRQDGQSTSLETPTRNTNTPTPAFETTTRRLRSSHQPATSTMHTTIDDDEMYDTDASTSSYHESRDVTPVSPQDSQRAVSIASTLSKDTSTPPTDPGTSTRRCCSCKQPRPLLWFVAVGRSYAMESVDCIACRGTVQMRRILREEKDLTDPDEIRIVVDEYLRKKYFPNWERCADEMGRGPIPASSLDDVQVAIDKSTEKYSRKRPLLMRKTRRPRSPPRSPRMQRRRIVEAARQEIASTRSPPLD